MDRCVKLMRECLDDTRAKASMGKFAGYFVGPRSIVGNGELPARIPSLVFHEDFAFLVVREGMLQYVDHEFRHDQSETDSDVRNCRASGRLYLDRDRPSSPTIDAARLSHSFDK